MDSTKAKQIYKGASAAHPVFIHGGEDCVSDQTRIVVKPEDVTFSFFTTITY